MTYHDERTNPSPYEFNIDHDHRQCNVWRLLTDRHMNAVYWPSSEPSPSCNLAIQWWADSPLSWPLKCTGQFFIQLRADDIRSPPHSLFSFVLRKSQSQAGVAGWHGILEPLAVLSALSFGIWYWPMIIVMMSVHISSYASKSTLHPRKYVSHNVLNLNWCSFEACKHDKSQPSSHDYWLVFLCSRILLVAFMPIYILHDLKRVRLRTPWTMLAMMKFVLYTSLLAKCFDILLL